MYTGLEETDMRHPIVVKLDARDASNDCCGKFRIERALSSYCAANELVKTHIGLVMLLLTSKKSPLSEKSDVVIRIFCQFYEIWLHVALDKSTGVGRLFE
jgi:hypothetical protein